MPPLSDYQLAVLGAANNLVAIAAVVGVLVAIAAGVLIVKAIW